MAAYKIPDTPTRNATSHEFADYLELLCIVNGGEYSISDAQSQIDIISDEDDQEGIMNEDDLLYDSLQNALEEIDHRHISCAGHYPFTSDRNRIIFDAGQDIIEQKRALVYQYLLLATRLNMIDHKIVEDIDGTLLFEEISALAVKNYFGSNAESLIFGTAAQGGFKDKISQLILKLGEGAEAKEPEESTNDERDGGLDVVAWRPFADKRKGKMIGFGQCKTGTTWRMQVGLLDPDDFCKTYFKDQPISKPINLFFVAESFKENYESIFRKAGIMFDRCRIMEQLSDVPDELITRIQKWINGNMLIVQEAYSIAGITHI